MHNLQPAVGVSGFDTLMGSRRGSALFPSSGEPITENNEHLLGGLAATGHIIGATYKSHRHGYVYRVLASVMITNGSKNMNE